MNTVTMKGLLDGVIGFKWKSDDDVLSYTHSHFRMNIHRCGAKKSPESTWLIRTGKGTLV